MGSSCSCRKMERSQTLNLNHSEHSLQYQRSRSRSLKSFFKIQSPQFKVMLSTESPSGKPPSDDSIDLGEESLNSFRIKLYPVNDKKTSKYSQKQIQFKVEKKDDTMALLQKYQMEQGARIKINKQMKESRNQQSRQKRVEAVLDRTSDQLSLLDNPRIQSFYDDPSPRRPTRHQSQLPRHNIRNQSYTRNPEGFRSMNLVNALGGIEQGEAELYSYRGRQSQKRSSSILKKRPYNQSNTETFSGRKKTVRFSLVPYTNQLAFK